MPVCLPRTEEHVGGCLPPGRDAVFSSCLLQNKGMRKHVFFLQAPVIVSVKVAYMHSTPNTKPPRPTINTVPEIARLPYWEKIRWENIKGWGGHIGDDKNASMRLQEWEVQ